MIKGYGEKLDNLYKSIREKNIKENSKRKEQLRETHPEILDLEKEITLLTLKMLRSKSLSQAEFFKNQIKSISKKKIQMLENLNLPSNFLDLQYDCNICKDTGYILTNKCSCFNKNLSSIYLKESDLKTLIEKNNFENFDFSLFSKDPIKNFSSPRENIKTIYKYSLNYIKNFENINTNLLFTGECGSGKTFLSHCIASELLKHGFLVIYKTSQDLFSELNTYYSKNESQKNINESILVQCDLLIIDDLGTEPQSNNSYSNFFNFLNKKILLNKKLLISTNYSLKNIKEVYSYRVYSRIAENFSIFNFYVNQDIRIAKKIRASECK